MMQVPNRPPVYGQQGVPQQGMYPNQAYQQPVQPIPRMNYPQYQQYPNYPEQEQESSKSWKYVIGALVITAIAAISVWLFRKRMNLSVNLDTSGKKQYIDSALFDEKIQEIASLKRIIEKQKEAINGTAVNEKEINGHTINDVTKGDLDLSNQEMTHENFKKSFGLPGTTKENNEAKQTIDSFIDWLVEQRGFTFDEENQYSNSEIGCKVILQKHGIQIKIDSFNPIFRPMTAIESVDFRNEFDGLIESAKGK